MLKPKIKHINPKKRRNRNNSTDHTPSRRKNRMTNLMSFDSMTSAELIDVFSAVTAIEKGISPPATTSKKVTSVTLEYKNSIPAKRKRMLHLISSAIVEQNKKENPATPEMIEKINRMFGKPQI